MTFMLNNNFDCSLKDIIYILEIIFILCRVPGTVWHLCMMTARRCDFIQLEVIPRDYTKGKHQEKKREEINVENIVVNFLSEKFKDRYIIMMRYTHS